MAKKENPSVFWIKKDQTFEGQGVGSNITDYFFNEKGESLSPKRLEKLIKNGYVSYQEPASVEVAEEAELNQLRATVKDLQEKNVDLQDTLDRTPKTTKLATAKAKEWKDIANDLEFEVEDLKKQIKDPDGKVVDLELELEKAQEKITGMEQQIEDLTEPGDK